MSISSASCATAIVSTALENLSVYTASRSQKFLKPSTKSWRNLRRVLSILPFVLECIPSAWLWFNLGVYAFRGKIPLPPVSFSFDLHLLFQPGSNVPAHSELYTYWI